MMYATYTIETKTDNFDWLQTYDSRQEAIDHLKRDAIFHLESTYKKVVKCREGAKWLEGTEAQAHQLAMSQQEGLYLRYSETHANRIIGCITHSVVVPGFIRLFDGSRLETEAVRSYGVVEVPRETSYRKPSMPLASELLQSRSSMRTISGESDSAEACDSTSSTANDALKKAQKAQRARLTIDVEADGTEAIMRELKACLKSRRAKIRVHSQH